MIYKSFELYSLIFNLVSFMGLFGNKDTKVNKDFDISKELIIPDAKPTETPIYLNFNAQPIPSKNIFQEFSQNYQAICNSMKRKWNEWMDRPQIRDARKLRKQLTNDYYQPLLGVYRYFPEKITQFKFDTFGNYAFKERLFGLEGLTLLVAIFTFNHRKAQFLPINRLLFATRNSAATYLLGGLLVAPEIFNPLLKSDI